MIYLQRISDILSIPVERFFEDDHDRLDESALLRAWHAIRDRGDRERVLDLVRGMAAKRDDGERR